MHLFCNFVHEETAAYYFKGMKIISHFFGFNVNICTSREIKNYQTYGIHQIRKYRIKGIQDMPGYHDLWQTGRALAMGFK